MVALQVVAAGVAAEEAARPNNDFSEGKRSPLSLISTALQSLLFPLSYRMFFLVDLQLNTVRMASAWSYTPLKPNESIRLLTLIHASDSSSAIHCYSTYQTKGKDYEYDALSYTWGNEKPTESTYILSNDTIFSLHVILNLFVVLQQFRHEIKTGSFGSDSFSMH
jgi:hypothetical protein